MSEIITDGIVPVEGPRILHQGRYRLYEKPDGTLRVQYRRDDREEDEPPVELPGGMIKVAKGMSEKSMTPMQMIAELTKVMMSMR